MIRFNIADATEFGYMLSLRRNSKHELQYCISFSIISICKIVFKGKIASSVFEEKFIEDRGYHEVIQDFAGRHVLYFKGRRSGFMPEYLDHPVKNIATWKENCKWRLNPKTVERYTDIEERMPVNMYYIHRLKGVMQRSGIDL